MRFYWRYGFKILSLFLPGLIIMNSKADAYSFFNDSIPTMQEVGAARLVGHIAPVKAPFKMPEFKKPVFPRLKINITKNDADPGALATKAIQATIDEVNKKGGGTVLIPAGIWHTGRIILKSNVDLFLAKGSELHFVDSIADYQPVVFTRSAGVEGMSLGGCIYAAGQNNIAITGEGKLVGPGDKGNIRKHSIAYGHIAKIVPLDKPASERIYDGKDGRKVFLPPMISTVNCKNVYIEGVSLSNSVFWNIVPIYCDHVTIRGVTVNSVGIPSGDGIDISSCKNVLIEYCTLSCGDDCFTMKAGRGLDGLRVNKPTENVVVRYCLTKDGMGGVTCGSETAGMIKNLYVHDCVFDRTDRGIRLKTRRPRGGGGENLYFERIRMTTKKEAITVDMLGSSMYVGKLAKRMPGQKPQKNKLTPHYKNVVIKNIIVGDSRQFLKIDGLPESLFENLLIENAQAYCSGIMSIHDARDIKLQNVTIQSDANQINLLDAHDILFDNVRFLTPEEQIKTNEMDKSLSTNIKFDNCFPSKPAGWKSTKWKK